MAERSESGRGSHFDHLLFPEDAPSDSEEPDRGTSTDQRLVFLLQRYYWYYRSAIRDALTRYSRKPFKCGGLRGYDQLKSIQRHLTAQKGVDVYLDELQRRVQAALEATESQAKDVHQARILLTEVEHYLAQVPRPELEPDPGDPNPATPGSEAVRKELEEKFNAWKQETLGSTAQRLLNKWNTMSPTWLPGILHCYDISGLPRHNLKLEGIFGSLRRHQRRVSGRKETTPLRIFGPGEIMVQVLEEEEFLPWLQAVPAEEYWTQRRKQEEREEPQRWLRRLRRDAEQAMSQIDEQFYEVVKELIRASPDTLVIRDD